MKKLIALLLVLVMAVSMIACGETPATEPSTNPTEPSTAPTEPSVKAPESAVALLNELFANIPEEMRYVIDVESGEFFLDENGEKIAVFNGGSFLFDEEGIPYYPGVNAAGTVDLTAEAPLFSLFVSDEYLANVEEAATLFHGMNGNTFTSGALKLKEGTDVEALAQSVADAIGGNFWMCGMPDRYYVATVGNYLLIVYGHDGVGDESFKTSQLVTPFVEKLAEMYPNTQVLADQMISG